MSAPVDAEGSRAVRPRPRIAVVGAGGVGGYFGGVLARAGCRVDILARGPHLDAMRQRGGIEIHEPEGSTFVASVHATDDPSALTGAAFAILAVKSYSLADVAPHVRALATSGSTIVPLLNGVDIADRLLAFGVPRATVLPGLTYVLTARTAPGIITRSGNFCRIVLGELDGTASDRARVLVETLSAAGVTAEATTAIVLELWRKFAFLAPMAAVCGLAHRPMGAVRAAPSGRAVIERAVRELVLVARAAGVAFADDDVRRTLGALEAAPDATRPSLLADLERGGPTEIDVLSSTVVRMARTFGIDTPIHEAAVAAISAQTGTIDR